MFCKLLPEPQVARRLPSEYYEIPHIIRYRYSVIVAAQYITITGVECRIHLVGLYSNRILSAKAGLHVVIEDHLQQNDSRLHWSVGEIRRGNLCRPEDSGREHMAKSYPIVDH